MEIKTIELAAVLSKLFVSKYQIHSDRADLLGIASLMIAVKARIYIYFISLMNVKPKYKWIFKTASTNVNLNIVLEK